MSDHATPPTPTPGHAATDAVLRVDDLAVRFRRPRGAPVDAVAGVSFDVGRSEVLGVVGESGCGKTTTGRAIMQLVRPTSGSVRLDDVELTELRGLDLRRCRRAMQMIFQDPEASLNPRRTVAQLIREGADIWRDEGEPVDEGWIAEVTAALSLDDLTARLPFELSGGQCQRVCIARALVMKPEVLILDEPVSALDVSVQAQILNLVNDLRDRYRLAMLFISHDLGVIRNVSDRVMVMYLGKVCEIAPVHELFSDPRHPYTRVLLDTVADHALTGPPPITGDPPSPISPPSGCRFRTRCPHATERCAVEVPELRQHADGHPVACHHHDDLS